MISAKKTWLFTILAVALLFSLASPALADDALYSIARQHENEVFEGVPSSDWGFLLPSQEQIMANIQNMPSGVNNWTKQDIDTILFQGVYTTDEAKETIRQNLALIEQKYLIQQPVAQDFWGSELEQVENTASFPEKIAAAVVVALPNFLVNVLDLQEPVTLIFQEVPDDLKGTSQEPDGFIPAEDLILYTFNDGEFQAVAMMYETFRAILPIILVVLLVAVGAMLYVSAWGNQRVDLRQRLLAIVVALVALVFAPYLWQIVFEVNWAVVQIAKSTFAHLGSISFFGLLYRPETQSLGMAIVSLIAAIGVGTLNWQYIMRKITLGVLIMIFPLVAAISIIKRGVLDIWVREFVSNVFLQSAHAIAYSFFILFTAYAGDSPQFFWYAMAFIMGINGVAGLVRRLIGAETVGSGMGQAVGSAVGLGSALALGRMAMMGMGSSVGRTAANSLGIAGGGPTGGPAGGGPTLGGPASPSTGGITGFRSASASVKRNAGALKTAAAVSKAAGKAAQIAGVGIGALSGAMIDGVLTGNGSSGLAAGASFGAIGGDKIQSGFNRVGNTASEIADEHLTTGESVSSIAQRKTGVFDSAQIFDPYQSKAVGQSLFGAPGAAAGYAVGHATSLAAPVLNKIGVAKEPVKRAKAMNDYLAANESGYLQSSQEIQNIKPQVSLAKEKMDYARSVFGEKSSQFHQAVDNYNDINAQYSGYKIQNLETGSALQSNEIQNEFRRLRRQPAVANYDWKES